MVVAKARDPYTVIPKRILQESRGWTQRFVATGNVVSQTFTVMDLAGLMGIIATAATTSVFFCNVFRIKSIKIWAIGAPTVPVTVSAAFVNLVVAGSAFLGGPPKLVEDTSASADRYAYVELRPPRNSNFFSSWINTSTGSNYCALTYPTGAIIDIAFQFYIDNLGTLNGGPTIAAGVAGTVYSKTVHNLVVQGTNFI